MQRWARSSCGVGGLALLLLFIGIHNAWDAFSHHVFVGIRNAKE